MKKTTRIIFTLLAVFSLMFFAVGCGSSDNGDGDAVEKYVFASETSFAPFEYVDSKSGDTTGFDIELVEALAEVMDVEIEVRNMNFDGIVGALESRNVDGAISAMTISEKRAKQVDFSDPYYRSDQSVAVRADNEEITSLNDLEDKKMGCQLGTTGEMLARDVSSDPDNNVTGYDMINDAFMALKNKNIDAVVNDFPVNYYYIQQGNEDVKIVEVVDTEEHYGMAFPKGSELVDRVNEGLATMKENGTYDEIYEKWFGEAPPAYLPGYPTEE
ncbi:MAG TPA: basic amino acid ABC transporter substrate-binding protein [Clostridia bacterium]|nr:basic amino acid ABC transporter substrate-binding protein [Clostridia bacterium]